MLLTTEAWPSPVEVRSAIELEAALSTLGNEWNEYASLGPSIGTFVQAVRTGSGFLVEYRDGAPDRHFRARREGFTRAEVIALFASYLAGDDAWRTSSEWEPADVRFARLREDGARRGYHAARVCTGWAFAAFAFALLAVALWDAISTASFVQGAQRTTGVVVGNTLSSDRMAYFAVVRFELNGPSVTFEDRVGHRSPRRVGESVAVLYDPATPARARIDTVTSLWELSIAIGGMGALVGAFAVRTLTAHRRRATSADTRRPGMRTT
jgi:hypothetical protein